jgi:hypothetical protein
VIARVFDACATGYVWLVFLLVFLIAAVLPLVVVTFFLGI